MLKSFFQSQPLSYKALTVVLFLASLAFNGHSQETPPTAQAQELNNNADPSQDESNSQSANEDKENAPPLFDALSAQAWMTRLSETTKQIPFEIAFVVSSPNKEILPYLWRHATLDNGDNAEQLSLLNGPGFEQIRINNRVSIFEPGFNPYSITAEAIDGPIPMAFIHALETINQAYEALLMGRNRISGRMAQQIRVVSKDKSRYGYHLWLDEQTGLLLKMNIYDLDGSLLEQLQVTQLTVNNDIKNYFANIQKEQLPPLVVGGNNGMQQLGWTVAYRPIGMEIIKQNLHRISITGEPAEYMLLSDGLIDVSVYVMQANDAIKEDISVTTDTTTVVSISDGRVQVTVVGEIPAATANKIANSIILVRAP